MQTDAEPSVVVPPMTARYQFAQQDDWDDEDEFLPAATEKRKRELKDEGDAEDRTLRLDAA